MITNGRIHYLDNLRAIAMFLGVVLHAALAYAHDYEAVWITSGEQHHRFFDGLNTFIHAFRMPLFFLIAGYFSHAMIVKDGLLVFIKNRLFRLGLPFILFWPVVMLALGGAFAWAAHYADYIPPIVQAMQLIPEGESLRLSTVHLWFIYYLLLFCLFTLFGVRFLSSIGNSIGSYLLQQSWHLMVLPLALLPASLAVMSPFPAPDSLVPGWWGILFYGVFFYWGWLFYMDKGYLARVKKYRLALLFASMAGFFVLVVYSEPLQLDKVMMPYAEQNRAHFIQAVVQSYLAVFLVVVILSYGKQFLSCSNRTLAYLAQSSYWVYIVHFPVLVFVQIFIGNFDLSLLFKFSISLALTMFVSLLSYQLLIRNTPIGWILSGRNEKRDIAS